MDLRSAAQIIRDTVSTRQIVELYGYKPKHGFIVCPFHGDKDASLKVYKDGRGWCCFGCGRSGSVIDFVMEHESCDFRTAVIAIDKAFSMGLTDRAENPFQAEDDQRFQRWLDEYAATLKEFADAIKHGIERKLRADLARVKEIEMMIATGSQEGLTAQDYTFKDRWKDEAQYDEYRLTVLDDFKEEVSEWRRKARRARSA